MKICTKCDKKKPLHMFHKHPQSKDGRASECKRCKSIVDRDYNARRRKDKYKKAREEATRPYNEHELKLMKDFLNKRGA